MAESKPDRNRPFRGDDAMPSGGPIAPARRTVAGALVDPSTLVLVAANLLPLIGVLAWNWDIYLVLVAYWAETAIAGFWLFLRIANVPRSPARPGQSGPPRAATILAASLYGVHAGLFMTVHFFFLWVLFAGAWRDKVNGAGDFIATVIVGTGLWIVLVALFVSHGYSFLRETGRLPGWAPTSARAATGGPPTAAGSQTGDAGVRAFYTRIVTLHVAIIIGGFFALAYSSIAPVIILVTLKTVADVVMHAMDLRRSPAPIAVASAPAE
jgi:hypothetical protein